MANKFEYRTIGKMGKTLGGTRIRFRNITSQADLRRMYNEGVSMIEKIELDVKPKTKKIVKDESEDKGENNIKSQEITGEAGE
tara:strand:- start:7 stop:255 length:249 start_codon:yes stop_codon:yes gene_type:complete